jgi:hypothetical protein
MNAQRTFWRLAVSFALSGAVFFTPYFEHIHTFAEPEKEQRSKVDNHPPFWHADEASASAGEGSRTHPADTMKASTDSSHGSALEVWEKYTQCEKTREFRPCFALLSRNTLRIWQEQGIKTVDEYDDSKGSGEVWFSDFKVLNVAKSDRRIIITAWAKGGGERGDFEAQREYILVLENDKWKVDTIREGTVRYLP